MKRIYLDYAATTPVDPEVLRAMVPYFSEKFGNPGSLHSFGQEAIAAVDMARESVAKAIGLGVEGFREVVFTGSATEANNLALRGAVMQFKKTHPNSRARIIISAIEHESVLETAHELEREGLAEVVIVPVNHEGVVDEKIIKDSLTENTALVSVMYANNEIGTIQPIQKIAAIIKEHKGAAGAGAFPLFHTDAVQAFQFFDCNVSELGVDMMTVSSHKIYGPKGVGALYIKNSTVTTPIIFGGGQEFGLRSGTENVASIAGFAKAVELAVGARASEAKRIAELGSHFWNELKKTVPNAELNGAPLGSQNRLPNILNIHFSGVASQDLLTKLDLAGIAASAGSACRARAVTASYVIAALGSPADGNIRISFGRTTTKEEIDAAIQALKPIFTGSSYTLR